MRIHSQRATATSVWVLLFQTVSILWLLADGDVSIPTVAAFSLGSLPASTRLLQKISPIESVTVLRQSTSESEFATSLSSSSAASSANNEYSFFDEVSIYVRAGSGGQGSSTYKKAKKSQNGIPDGGSGGPGGNIVLEVDASLNTLASFSTTSLGGSVNDNNSNNKKIVSANANNSKRLMSFRAETGLPGGRMYDNGRKGEDCVVRVPPGTVVSIEHEPDNDKDDEVMSEAAEAANAFSDDNIPNEESEDDTSFSMTEIGTLSLDQQPSLIVARGGQGGEGTATLKGKKKGATRRGPEGGERFRLRLTLKIVADIALVGVPNAGKSTFLAAVTRAEPKIANYPFTTVVPNLGVWIPPLAASASSSNKENTRGGDKAAGSTGIVLCDVPGLIEGAAEGVGLGHAFLRHVERCRVILHLVDGTSETPVGDYEMVNQEIQRYGTGSLASKPQVVVVNKIDTWEEEVSEEECNRRKAELEQALKESMGHTRIMWVSAKERQNMDELMLRMASYVENIKESDSAKVVPTKES